MDRGDKQVEILHYVLDESSKREKAKVQTFQKKTSNEVR